MDGLNGTKTHNHQLVLHRGFKLITGTHDPDDVDQIYDLEIRDSDVFVVTYPKSGERSIEVTGNSRAFVNAPSPRLRVTHLLHWLMPSGLSQRGKVIYVARNPKDVLVSYYHFHKVANMLETPKDFDDFFEKFMRGDVFGGSWFDHVKTWFSHKDNMNMLFITYEEMIQDLQAAVERISSFLGKELTEEQLANVVKHSTFKNMRKIPQANYEQVSVDLLNHHQGRFMRKGTIGDWKNHFTVAQSERFDMVFHKEMKDFPLSFVWDIE
ncbi:hypothetical protein INR49_002638 [Caranx melampygus]|nr:hypothetical protein INR49_002638 [Caranx melampygus]